LCETRSEVVVFLQVCGLSHKVFKEREFHAGMQEGVKEGALRNGSTG
jgi:hypothetical protein